MAVSGFPAEDSAVRTRLKAKPLSWAMCAAMAVLPVPALPSSRALIGGSGRGDAARAAAVIEAPTCSSCSSRSPAEAPRGRGDREFRTSALLCLRQSPELTCQAVRYLGAPRPSFAAVLCPAPVWMSPRGAWRSVRAWPRDPSAGDTCARGCHVHATGLSVRAPCVAATPSGPDTKWE